MAGLLRSLGHCVAEFSDAAEFLASDDLERTVFLISDLTMPGMNGLRLHRWLADAGRAVPTALMTAYPTDRSRAEAERAGIAYFVKPVSPAHLSAWLANAGPLPGQT